MGRLFLFLHPEFIEGPMIDLLTFLILILATWRLSSLLVNEEGPFGVFLKLRLLIASFTDLLTCVWCCSVWIGLAFTLLYCYQPLIAFWVALPLAISTGAIALERGLG